MAYGVFRHRSHPSQLAGAASVALLLVGPAAAPASPDAVTASYEDSTAVHHRRAHFRTQQGALPAQLFSFAAAVPSDDAITASYEDPSAVHRRGWRARPSETTLPAELFSFAAAAPSPDAVTAAYSDPTAVHYRRPHPPTSEPALPVELFSFAAAAPQDPAEAIAVQQSDTTATHHRLKRQHVSITDEIVVIGFIRATAAEPAVVAFSPDTAAVRYRKPWPLVQNTELAAALFAFAPAAAAEPAVVAHTPDNTATHHRRPRAPVQQPTLDVALFEFAAATAAEPAIVAHAPDTTAVHYRRPWPRTQQTQLSAELVPVTPATPATPAIVAAYTDDTALRYVPGRARPSETVLVPELFAFAPATPADPAAVAGAVLDTVATHYRRRVYRVENPRTPLELLSFIVESETVRCAPLDRPMRRVAAVLHRVFGQDATITYVASSTYDVITGSVTRSISTEVERATVMRARFDGSPLEMGTLLVTFAASVLNDVPKVGDTVTVGGEVYEAIRVDRFYSGEKVAMYALEVRR